MGRHRRGPAGRPGQRHLARRSRRTVRAQGDYGILEDYVGHGIGTQMHHAAERAQRRPSRRAGPKLVAGLALAVEPMVTLGTPDTDVLDDDWTVVTADGSLAAHFEHTFALTPNGAWVLTALDGGEERLAALGVPSVDVGCASGGSRSRRSDDVPDLPPACPRKLRPSGP